MRYNLIINPIRRLAALVDQPDGWQARHFAVAPFGGLLSTWLWVNCGPQWAQIDNFGVLFYGALAVMLEGGYQVFYAISKRRRDINAAEDRGREEGREEGLEEGLEKGRTATLDDLAARLKDNPDAIAAISELRAQSQNGRHQ